MWPQRLRRFDRWTRPCFCFATPRPVPTHWRDGTLTNAATRHMGRFRPVFYLLQSPRNSEGNFREGTQALRPCLNRLTECIVSEPIWERPAGPKTHARRTGRKLGQTRWARQGLVRVPESNTKYGGKGGITGGDPTPVIGPTISESSGIPKGKKLSPPCGASLRPLFTGQVFFHPSGLHWRDSP
jgi:hypothetical protein